jgi:hypothetical protein
MPQIVCPGSGATIIGFKGTITMQGNIGSATFKTFPAEFDAYDPPLSNGVSFRGSSN